MFLDNYIARSARIEKKNKFKYIKFGVISFFIITILITFNFSLVNENKMGLNKELLGDKFYKDQNVVKVENAKLIGNDKNNKPYMITAASSFKKTTDKNIIYLHLVEADITLNNNSWMLLNTSYASFNLLKKTISAKEKVYIFYDNGTKLESTNLIYNVSEGIGLGEEGVKMFGEWGRIEANAFSFDTKNQKIKFFNKPKLVLN